MAKKKKKGANAQNVGDLSKSALKAYHKEICEFYVENGWRDTLSSYLLSPKQGAEIIPQKVRDRRKEVEKASKKKAPKRAKAPKKKGTEKAPKKVSKKAEKAPKKVSKAPKKAGKKLGRPKKTAGKQKVQEPSSMDEALDFLLAYRSANGGVTLDEAIIDLTIRSRAA